MSRKGTENLNEDRHAAGHIEQEQQKQPRFPLPDGLLQGEIVSPESELPAPTLGSGELWK